MGIKERRTKILLSLILLSDDSPIPFDEKLQTLFDLSFNQKTRGTISGMIREGLIEKESIPDDKQSAVDSSIITNQPPTIDIRYRLTEKGFSALCLEFPFFRFLKHSWDGRWRIISYEIPESKREMRDRLRREMQGWGLGPWHRSFWITPHPVISVLQNLVSQKEEEQYLQTFEAEHSFGNRETLIEKVWGMSSLDKKYRSLFKIWHDTLSQNMEKMEKFERVIAEYIGILRCDPGLPKELLGEQWIGFEAFTLFKEIRSILLSS